MNLRRTAVLAAVVVAALAVIVPSSTASETGAKQELVCMVTAATPDDGMTVRRPSAVVNELVGQTQSYRGSCREIGERAELGNGTISAYSQVDGSRPTAVGMLMTDGVLDGLPLDPANDDKWCFDKDGNGTVDPNTECSGGYESQLELGRNFQRRINSPFTYVLNNWNPHGHIPVGVYNVPHFDVHFYTNPDSERTAIRPGPCPALVNCDDYELGKRLPEAKYLAPDYIDVDAVEPAMGNHLVDPTAPEFNGVPFTHTFLYGVWDTEVTFYEPMVTHEVFSGLRDGTIADACHNMKLPSAWQESGWYPTKYCLRHNDNRSEMTISLESFVFRQAS